MSDGNDKVLEKLGELSGLMIATREDVKLVSTTQREHGSSIQNLATSIQVMRGCVQNIDTQTKHELSQVNEKLGRDYDRINVLEKDKTVANGISAYKAKKRAWWQWALGIVGGFIGILIGINQLIGIAQKLNLTTTSPTPSTYAATLNPKDSLKDTTKAFTVMTDTIKGDR